MRNLRVGSLAQLYIIVLISSSLLVSTTDGQMEIEKGDWAVYEILAFKGSATEEKEWAATHINETNNIECINVTVEEVLFVDKFRVAETTYFKNGTPPHITTYVGSPNTPEELHYWIIPSDLEEGEKVFGVENFTVRFRSEEYVNVTRSVNRGARLTKSGNQTWMFEFYWDNPTGFLCRSLATCWLHAQIAMYVQIKLVDTNMWASHSHSGSSGRPWEITAIVLIIAITAITSAFLLIRRKKRLTSKRK